MKILVVYYSRSGVTRLVAENIAKTIGADVEEIEDRENRRGVSGFLRCGYEAMFNKLTKIGELKADVSAYDLVVVGSPIWAGRLAPPATTFLKKYQAQVRSLALFLTHADEHNRYDNVLTFMEKAAGQKSVRSLSLTSSAAKMAGNGDVIRFANELNKL